MDYDKILKLAHLRNMLRKQQVKENYNRQDPIPSKLIILWSGHCVTTFS